MEILLLWMAVGFLSGCLTVGILSRASNDLTWLLAIVIIVMMTALGVTAIIFAIPLLIGFLINFDGERL